MALNFHDRKDILIAMMPPMEANESTDGIVEVVLDYFGKRFAGRESEVREYVFSSLDIEDAEAK